MNKKSDKKIRENALKKINKLNKVSKIIPQKNVQEKNKNIRKKIIKKESTKDKKIIKKESTKDKKTNEKNKKIFHQNKKSDKIAKKSDKKYNKKKISNNTMSRRLPLIKNQSGGLGGIGDALLDMFISIPPVFVNFYDLGSNMSNEFSSLQKLPDQIKNAAPTQPGQPLS